MDAIISDTLQAIVFDAQGDVDAGVGAEVIAESEVEKGPEIPGGGAGSIGNLVEQFIAGHGVVDGIGLETQGVRDSEVRKNARDGLFS